MATDYTTLDTAIVNVIGAGCDGATSFNEILNSRDVSDRLSTIALNTGRDKFRILDGRLQSLRKRGQLEFYPIVGWRVA